MRLVCGLAILGISSGLLTLVSAQQPGDRPGDAPKKAGEKGNSPAVQRIIDSLMALDKNKDGKITKDEVTDRRLQRLFERADADKDGVVTKEELTKEATRMAEQSGGGGKQGSYAPGGPGGSGSGGFGPPAGSGGFAPPTPGQILHPFLQDSLKLTAEQKKQLGELQKEVDAKLGKILTEEQKTQLKQMRNRFGRGGPGGPPPGRGPGGPPSR